MTATAEALPLDRIHDLAANYSDRQGLRVVPMAVTLLFLNTWQMIHHAPRLPVDPLVLTLVIGVGGYYLFGIYYRRRFGNVEELAYDGLPIALQGIFVFLCLLVSMSIDVFAKPPLFLSGLVIAGWLIATSWSSRHVRKQYFTGGVWLAIISVFFPLVALQSQQTTASFYATQFAVILLFAGVRDHIDLVRAFPPVEAEHE